MQPLQVFEKPAGEHADLTTGKRDSVIGRKGRADLLPLPVAEKTLQSDVNHDVVTDDAARRNETRESSRPFLPTATGNAHAHRLPQPEAAMVERHTGALPCLCDTRATAANQAGRRRLAGVNEHAGNTLRPLPALVLQLPDCLPQGRDLGERDRAAVFFTP